LQRKLRKIAKKFSEGSTRYSAGFATIRQNSFVQSRLSFVQFVRSLRSFSSFVQLVRMGGSIPRAPASRACMRVYVRDSLGLDQWEKPQ